MKAGDIFISKKNNKIGMRLETYIGNKTWIIQGIDIIEDRPTRNFLFERASVNNIHKNYNIFSNILEE